MSMGRRFAMATVIATGAAIGGMPVRTQPAQDVPPSFRASTDLVAVNVSVTRGNGQAQPITGLRIGDFVLTDNGVPQQLVDMSYGKLPIDVTVAIDLSGSVTGAALEELRQATAQLVRRLGPEDRLKLMAFNMTVVRLFDYTDRDKVSRDLLRGATAGGSTALLDTLAVALTATAPQGRRQLVMVLSDGNDTASITDGGTILELAQRATPTVSFVLRIGRDARGRPVPVPALYPALARETGGEVVSTLAIPNPVAGIPVTSIDVVGSRFTELLDRFRSQYVLHYMPAGVEQRGYHALEVRVNRENVRVQARRGYLWAREGGERH